MLPIVKLACSSLPRVKLAEDVTANALSQIFTPVPYPKKPGIEAPKEDPGGWAGLDMTPPFTNNPFDNERVNPGAPPNANTNIPTPDTTPKSVVVVRKTRGQAR